MKSEWTDNATVQVQCGNLFGNELTQYLSGNIQPQSSQLAEQLWTDPPKILKSEEKNPPPPPLGLPAGTV